ncbi:hypothetical protein C0J52_24989 [Blattella germanica]|nr:hypothetical protein C0J52_24989 [Blattella germanica]
MFNIRTAILSVIPSIRCMNGFISLWIRKPTPFWPLVSPIWLNMFLFSFSIMHSPIFLISLSPITSKFMFCTAKSNSISLSSVLRVFTFRVAIVRCGWLFLRSLGAFVFVTRCFKLLYVETKCSSLPIGC